MPRLLILLVGLALAAAGVTDYTDGIVRYVARIVDGMAFTDLYQPAFDPPPMNTYTYRPLTVLMVKLELLLCGRDPFYMTLLHGLSIPWLGFATHRFCRTHGLQHVALPCALSTMALPSMLFAGWIPVESDAIGAAFLCEAAFFLQTFRTTLARRHLVGFALMAFGAATTKETSAAAMFGYLLAFTWAYRHAHFKRWLAVLSTYSAVLLVLILPFLLSTAQTPHNFHVQSQGFNLSRAGFMLLHNLAQIFYVTSSGGAVLIALHLVTREQPNSRWAVIALAASALFLFAAPPMRVYNHYESVIIDQVVYVALCGTLLLTALVIHAIRGSAEHVTLAGTVLFLFFVLAVAPILMLQSRPDVSARLYAPIVPIVHGLAWAAAWHFHTALQGRRRWLGWAVSATFALFVPLSAANGIQQFRARMDVELVAKTQLAALLKQAHVTCPFVIATNRNAELATEELQVLGVNWTACSELFVPNHVDLDPADADLDSWGIQGHRYNLLPTDQSHIAQALLAGRAPQRCVYLYVQTPKAMWETQNFQDHAGDFSWAFGRLPEFDEEVYQQQIEIQFREQLGYQKLFKRARAKEFTVESTYDLFPANPNTLVRRLLAGRPLIEAYAYEGRILALEKCRNVNAGSPAN